MITHVVYFICCVVYFICYYRNLEGPVETSSIIHQSIQSLSFCSPVRQIKPLTKKKSISIQCKLSTQNDFKLNFKRSIKIKRKNNNKRINVKIICCYVSERSNNKFEP